jgi:hypothetical protein
MVRLMRTPRGSALLELVLALPLSALLATAAVQIMLSQLRVARQVQARVAGTRELEHAVLALASDLRASAATDLETWSDTSITLHAQVFVGTVCGAPAPHVIDVIGGAPSSPLRASLSAAPRAGDRLLLGVQDTALLGESAVGLDTMSVGANIASAATESSACASSAMNARAGGTPWRITLVAASPAWPRPGDVVVVTRRTEWRAYRASDQQTYLGRRDWNGLSWSTIQPVVGPLRSNAQGGFRLRVTGANGAQLFGAHPDAKQVHVRLASAHRVGGSAAVLDSLDATLSLRGGR